MSDKKPTDTQIIRGFNDFEKGLNVFIAWFRNQPGYGEGSFSRETLSMWKAHKDYRLLALAAQERIDARKRGRDRDTVEGEAGSSGTTPEGEHHG